VLTSIYPTQFVSVCALCSVMTSSPAPTSFTHNSKHYPVPKMSQTPESKDKPAIMPSVPVEDENEPDDWYAPEVDCRQTDS